MEWVFVVLEIDRHIETVIEVLLLIDRHPQVSVSSYRLCGRYLFNDAYQTRSIAKQLFVLPLSKLCGMLAAQVSARSSHDMNNQCVVRG